MRGGLGVSLALASGQQLLQGVREQLVRGHVLTAPEQLAGRDLVEDGGHLVVSRQAVEDVVLEGLHRCLESPVIAARQRNLVAAPSSRPSRRSRWWRIGVRAFGELTPSGAPASSVGRSSGSAVER